MKRNNYQKFRLTKSLCLAALLLVGVGACKEKTTSTPTLANLTQYVDPYIGTGDHGHVFMGANVPFGAIQLGPNNYSQGWDWCSGYHISDSTIIGFSHLHLSGTGIGDLGDIAFMPATGAVKMVARGDLNDPSTNFMSKFSRSTEKAKAGYYAVRLDRYGIDVELTATQRVGFHKYTFPEASDAKVIIDLEQGIGWDSPVESYVVQENDTVVSGYRYSRGWAKDQRIYFSAVFSKPITGFEVYKDSVVRQHPKTKQDVVVRRGTFADVKFATSKGEQIYVKVAVSPISINNAKANMQAELAGWDFPATVAAADLAWNKELNKIVIKADNDRDKRVFYTALYHSMIAPSVFNDYNGDYWGTDKQVHSNPSFVNYTTFSLWDTYRAAHPLMTIIHPEKVNDMVNTMLAIYKQQGKLPVWHLMANETDCMVGNPGIPVVADAYLKGFDGFDAELAFEAMKNSALLDERGLKFIKSYGYLPYDSIVESVAKGMEYALADWAVAQTAKKMGKTEDYELFSKRAKAYKHYFDPSTNFMRAKDSKGVWRKEFDPFDASHRTNDYTEGNAWQYTWLVPHDVAGLVKLFGSEDAFVKKLDSLFIVEGDLGAEASPDVSGLIGQYAHGNEPSHHILYLYPYLGQPWKTADRVREVVYTMYSDQPAGLSGNEDVGQMSSWYVLSALGFYQVAPAGGIYVFGSPSINEAVIQVGKGTTFTIIANNNSKENKYIQSVTLNGKPYSKSYIQYSDIVAGGTLVFEMGNTPSSTWGVDPADRP